MAWPVEYENISCDTVPVDEVVVAWKARLSGTTPDGQMWWGVAERVPQRDPERFWLWRGWEILGAVLFVAGVAAIAALVWRLF